MAQVFSESDDEEDPLVLMDDEAARRLPIGAFGWTSKQELCKISDVTREDRSLWEVGWRIVGRVAAGDLLVHHRPTSRRCAALTFQEWYGFKLDVCARLWGLDKLVAKSKPLVWELVMDFLRGK